MALKVSINHIIPEDVIREIFLHCISPDPLKFRQPDTTLAPILLCHVCSYWRDIAFHSPRIWTHLYHVARYPRRSFKTVDNRDLSFLVWWHDKVKDVPPSLRLEFQSNVGVAKKGYQASSIDIFLDFIVKFIYNARYLNIDTSYNRLLRTLVTDSQQPFFCQNLGTLVLRRPYKRYLQTQRKMFFEKQFVPVTSKQPLHRVLVEDMPMDTEDIFSNVNFSTITHLHLAIRHSGFSVVTWFTLLRQCVNLTHGSFNITFYLRSLEVSHCWTEPVILPYLRQLVFQDLGGGLNQSFIEGVHLPALVALRILHLQSLNIDQLHRILSSTPALQTLQLGNSLTLNDRPSSPNFIFIKGDLASTQTPLSHLVPDLSSIHFEYKLPITDTFLLQSHDLILSVLTGNWLQVGRPGNRIYRIQLGSSDGSTRHRLCRVVKDLSGRLPAGLEFSVRPSHLPAISSSWESRYHDFTDDFEGMMFDST